MEFDRIVDAAAADYLQHVRTHQKDYPQILFGQHMPEQCIGATAHMFKQVYAEGGTDKVYTYATGKTSLGGEGGWKMLVLTDLYARIREKAGQAGIVLPEMDVGVDRQIDHRARLARNEMEKPGEGWGLGQNQ